MEDIIDREIVGGEVGVETVFEVGVGHGAFLDGAQMEGTELRRKEKETSG